MTLAISENCPNCASSLEGAEDRCYTCRADIGVPNVRTAQTSKEKSALLVRRAAAERDAERRGVASTSLRFSDAIGRSAAVINVELEFLKKLITEPKTLYSTYNHMVDGGTRKAAKDAWDRHRTTVGSTLFGSSSKHITYAALSMECRGLESYGRFTIKLKDVAISSRASLLDENSYMFVKRHKIVAGDAIPLGFRSTWEDRNLLAYSKVVSQVVDTTTENEFQTLLLKSTGDSQTDEFIEVHIFGGFDGNAVEAVAGPVPTDGLDAALWEVTKEHLINNSRIVEEY